MSEICFKITQRVRSGDKCMALGGGKRENKIGLELIIVEDERCKNCGFFKLFFLLLHVEHFHYAKFKTKDASGLLLLLAFIGGGGKSYQGFPLQLDIQFLPLVHL